jgi:uncharacterized protein YecT (DUF1311 family)
MKPLSIAIAIALAIGAFSKPALAGGKAAHDPCRTKQSNFDMRECYTKEHAKVDSQLDSYLRKISAAMRKDVHKNPSWTVPNEILLKSASRVEASQKSWNAYRDDLCTSVEYSYTTGSGAGTAYEECMFHLGQARLQELHRYFGYLVGEKPSKNDPSSFLM